MEPNRELAVSGHVLTNQIQFWNFPLRLKNYNYKLKIIISKTASPY